MPHPPLRFVTVVLFADMELLPTLQTSVGMVQSREPQDRCRPSTQVPDGWTCHKPHESEYLASAVQRALKSTVNDMEDAKDVQFAWSAPRFQRYHDRGVVSCLLAETYTKQCLPIDPETTTLSY